MSIFISCEHVFVYLKALQNSVTGYVNSCS